MAFMMGGSQGVVYSAGVCSQDAGSRVGHLLVGLWTLEVGYFHDVLHHAACRMPPLSPSLVLQVMAACKAGIIAAETMSACAPTRLDLQGPQNKTAKNINSIGPEVSMPPVLATLISLAVAYGAIAIGSWMSKLQLHALTNACCIPLLALERRASKAPRRSVGS